MAITVNAATATLAENANGTALTISVPSATANGDVLVLSLASGTNSGFPATITGWTTVKTDTAVASAAIGMYYRVASSEPASYTVTVNNAADRITAEMVRLTGVDTTTPLDVAAASTSSSSTTTSMATPTLTTVTAGAVLLYAVELNNATATITVPSGVTLTKTSAGTGQRSTLGSELRSTTGASTSRTWTFSTGAEHSGITAAFRPSSGTTTGSGSFAGTGSGTLAVTGTPTPAQSAAFTGSGTVTATGTPKPQQSATFSGSGTLTAQPGTVWHAAGSGTLAATVDSVDIVGAAVAFTGSGGFSAGTPASAGFTGSGTLTASGFAAIVGRGLNTNGLANDGQLTVETQAYHYCFTGPAVYDYRPLEKAYPQLLHIYIPYGTTVWQDAGGDWHNKFWPGPDELTGAQRIFPGGRCNELDDDDLAAVTASPYADLIHMEKTE